MGVPIGAAHQALVRCIPALTLGIGQPVFHSRFAATGVSANVKIVVITRPTIGIVDATTGSARALLHQNHRRQGIGTDPRSLGCRHKSIYIRCVFRAWERTGQEASLDQVREAAFGLIRRVVRPADKLVGALGIEEIPRVHKQFDGRVRSVYPAAAIVHDRTANPALIDPTVLLNGVDAVSALHINDFGPVQPRMLRLEHPVGVQGVQGAQLFLEAFREPLLGQQGLKVGVVGVGRHFYHSDVLAVNVTCHAVISNLKPKVPIGIRGLPVDLHVAVKRQLLQSCIPRSGSYP